MRSKHTLGRKVSLGPVVAFVAFLAPRVAADTTDVSIALPELSVKSSPAGAVLAMDGFDAFGHEGDPRLLTRAYTIVLPADADPATASVRVASSSFEERTVERLAPVGRMVEYREEGGLAKLARPDGLSLEGGKNTRIFGTKAFYPSGVVLGSHGWRHRGWKLVTVVLVPALYRDSDRRLRVAKELTLTVSYSLLASRASDPSRAVVSAGAKHVKAIVEFEGLQLWNDVSVTYDVEPDSGASEPDILVVTTEAIDGERDENGLADWIAHKEDLGHAVVVATVEEIDASYSSGDLPKKIKKYIKSQYQDHGIDCVLLVGNPDPNAQGSRANVFDPGMVPMRECRTEGESSMTDMYYADFDADWDKDGDGNYGESWDETGSPDVCLGRIAPVGGYVDDVIASNGGTLVAISRQEKLRAVFEKIVKYDRQFDKSWRHKMLPIGSYMYGTDGGTSATTLQKTVSSIHDRDSSFEADGCYQDGTAFGLSDPWFDGVASYPGNPEASYALLGDNSFPGDSGTAYYVWSNVHYGSVLWRGHGSWDASWVGHGDTGDGWLLYRSWILGYANDGRDLDNEYPAVVSCASCNNMSTGAASYNAGDYDMQQARWASLAQTLLWKGAIAVIAATNTTGSEDPCPEDPTVGQNAWYQRYFHLHLALGESFGHAHMATKQYVHSYYSSGHKTRLQDWLRMNLLGDPSQVMFQSTSSIADDDNDAGSGNDSFANATSLYRGLALTLDVRVSNAVSKDDDYHVLAFTNPSATARNVEVKISRDLSLGDLSIRVYDGSRRPIAGSSESDESQVRWLSNSATSSSTLYVVVRKGTHVTEYDLQIHVE